MKLIDDVQFFSTSIILSWILPKAGSKLTISRDLLFILLKSWSSAASNAIQKKKLVNTTLKGYVVTLSLWFSSKFPFLTFRIQAEQCVFVWKIILRQKDNSFIYQLPYNFRLFYNVKTLLKNTLYHQHQHQQHSSWRIECETKRKKQEQSEIAAAVNEYNTKNDQGHRHENLGILFKHFFCSFLNSTIKMEQ